MNRPTLMHEEPQKKGRVNSSLVAKNKYDIFLASVTFM